MTAHLRHFALCPRHVCHLCQLCQIGGTHAQAPWQGPPASLWRGAPFPHVSGRKARARLANMGSSKPKENRPMNIEFVGLSSTTVAHLKAANQDAYDHEIERHEATEGACPCRHCLETTTAGETFLTLAHRPFATTNPYTETGPIFLCASECKSFAPRDVLPSILKAEHYIVRGYCDAERIVYGTGRVVKTDAIRSYAQSLFQDTEIAFVDIRSASNNCFLCRVRRVAI